LSPFSPRLNRVVTPPSDRHNPKIE